MLIAWHQNAPLFHYLCSFYLHLYRGCYGQLHRIYESLRRMRRLWEPGQPFLALICYSGRFSCHTSSDLLQLRLQRSFPLHTRNLWLHDLRRLPSGVNLTEYLIVIFILMQLRLSLASDRMNVALFLLPYFDGHSEIHPKHRTLAHFGSRGVNLDKLQHLTSRPTPWGARKARPPSPIALGP